MMKEIITWLESNTWIITLSAILAGLAALYALKIPILFIVDFICKFLKKLCTKFVKTKKIFAEKRIKRRTENFEKKRQKYIHNNPLSLNLNDIILGFDFTIISKELDVFVEVNGIPTFSINVGKFDLEKYKFLCDYSKVNYVTIELIDFLLDETDSFVLAIMQEFSKTTREKLEFNEELFNGICKTFNKPHKVVDSESIHKNILNSLNPFHGQNFVPMIPNIYTPVNFKIK